MNETRIYADAFETTFANTKEGRYCHPTQNRGLSIREAARLQSFDDKFEFQGNMGEMSLQIGNAVPPKLAQASGKIVINYMGLYEEYLGEQTKNMVTR